MILNIRDIMLARKKYIFWSDWIILLPLSIRLYDSLRKVRCGHRKLIFFHILFFLTIVLLTGCMQSFNQTNKSPEFEYIQEYTYSPDRSNLALVVPLKQYSRQTGLEQSQIIVLDSENWEILYSKEFSEFGPYNLQWAGDDNHLLYMMNNLKGTNPSLIDWDITTDNQIVYPFFHTGFTVSKSGDSLVAWGTKQQQENGEPFEVIDGQLHLYSLPDIQKYNALTIPPGNDLEIRHVDWSDDDKELLILGRMNHLPAQHTIYRLNVFSGEEENEIIDVPTWNSFSWNSTNDLIAFTNVFGLDIYHSGYDCYIAHLDFTHTPYTPLWDSYSLVIIQDEGPVQGKNQLVELNFGHLANESSSDCLE